MPPASPDLRRRILPTLADGPATGPEMADEFGVSRTAIWKQIESLRSAGFDIQGSTDGYRVRSPPDYGALAIEYGMDAPYRVDYHDVIDSTNDRARSLARDGAADVVVVADQQRRGRGRTDREWASPAGGIWASIVIQPTIPAARVAVLTLAGAVSVARAARECGVEARIKWPNDVVVPDPEFASMGGRKLAGILTEIEGQADRVAWAIVGVGVNANVDPGSLPPGATSLQAETGTVDRRIFAQRLLETFHALAADPEETLSAWRTLECTLGRTVQVAAPDGDVAGEAVDITDNGALVIETEHGRRTVFAGDCRHLRF